jgi:hypothetical protein
MSAEIMTMMDNNQEEPTILDIAYELLDSEGPLSPEQMASASRGLGYDIAGWEFQAEIEQHLLVHGDRSPFIEAGRDLYGLWEQIDESAPDTYIPQFGRLAQGTRDRQPQQFNFATAAIGPPPPPRSLEFSFPGAANLHASSRQRHPLEFIFPGAIAIAMALALVLAVLNGGTARPSSRNPNTLFMPSTTVDNGTLQDSMPLSAAAEPVALSFSDDTWWFSNIVNQMNEETQAVARGYLSNYYNTCGPAVVAMLASYLLAQSEVGGGPITTAVVMHDARNKLEYYTPPYNSGLLEFKHLRTMLQLYGLDQVYPGGNSSLLAIEELLDRVRQGQPAIAGMRYRYQDDWSYRPSGGRGLYNHFVVVFGVEQVDGQDYLWVANPHPGKYLTSDTEAAPVRMSVDEFWQSWALKDGSENESYGHAAFFGG